MSTLLLKAVQLSLAEAGADLAAVLEAAQYARVIQPDEPESEAEEQAMTGFIEDFSACAEAWEEASSPERTTRLGRLNARLEALERLELYVHQASVTLGIDAGEGQAVRMPVAILTIGRSSLPSTTVMVPDVLGASSPDAERRH